MTNRKTLKCWKKVFWRFIDICIPRVKDYWSTSNVLSTPWFRSIMSRDRFLEILRYIHFVDSSQQKKKGEGGFNPLFKIRPLVDHLNAVFPEYYKASRYLSIDETADTEI